jgi:uncharacterized protein
MNEGTTGTQARRRDGGLDRRAMLQMSGIGLAALSGAAAISAATGAAEAATAGSWDKTFPKSGRVDHRKVTFTNKLGIMLVADLYVPKDLDRSERRAALVVGHPYGGVKEQTSGLYAQTMAERGFVTIAHDASFNGESGGQPHFTASAEAFVEDFLAAVDFLGTQPFVDRQRIGVIGVCGSGGFGLAAAEIDPRIKAVATVSMYDIGQGQRQGLAPELDVEALKKQLQDIAEVRWSEVDGADRVMAVGTPEALTESSGPIEREFYDYYRTPRGQHPRSTTTMARTSNAPMTLFWSFDKLSWISPRPVLFVTGDQAHSRIFSEQAHAKASEPKELHVVPGAGHVDLYDRVSLIPFDKLASFFDQHLA